MPVTTDTMYRMPRLNKLFAVSSLAMLASILWLIWDDTDRAWKRHQDDYMDAQVSLHHLDALIMQTDEKRRELEAARTRLEAARQRVAAQAETVAALEREQSETAGRLAAIQLDYGNLNGEMQVTTAAYEEAKTLHGADSPHTRELKERLERQRARLEELQRERDKIEDNNKRLDARLKEILQPQIDAQKEYDSLARKAAEARARSEQYAAWSRRKGLNLPLLDFAAPKGTIGRYEIRQAVLPDVRLDVNFMDTYVTDRCQTCHVAIDDPQFTRAGLAAKFEQAAGAINEHLAREGRDPLPFPLAPQRQNGPGNLSGPQGDEYLAQLSAQVNAYLSMAGLPEITIDQPLLAHPSLDLYVLPDSPHPMSKMGCTVCHEGNGFETDFVLAAHTAPDHETQKQWEHKYVRSYGATDFQTVEHYWDYLMTSPQYVEGNCTKCHSEVADISTYRGEPIGQRVNRGRYMFVSLGCGDCHLVKGLEDVRRVGPDLTHVASKLSTEFTREWIYFPKKYRPSTWMPHYFEQENNDERSERGLDPDPVARTRAEVVAITYYLEKASRPFAPEPVPADLSGDAERGRELFGSVGCLACHAALAHRPEADGPTLGQMWITDDLESREDLSAEEAAARYEQMTYQDQVVYAMSHFKSELDAVFDPGSIGQTPVFTRFAPELSSVRSKFKDEQQGVQWLYDWLRDPRHYSSYTKMPSLRLTPGEALDLAAYLMTLSANEEFDRSVESSDMKLDAAARAQIDELASMNLRAQNSEARTQDIMNDAGGELTGMLVSGLAKSLGADEAEALIGSLDLADKRVMFLGSKMMSHYACHACHLVPGFEDAPRPGTEMTDWGVKRLSQIDFAYFDPAFDETRGPEFEKLYPPDRTELIYWAGGTNPDQTIEHNRASFAWHKLRNPRIWDRKKIREPLAKLKMPNFYLTDDEADALVAFLLSRRPAMVDEPLRVDYENTLAGPIAAGRHLTRELNCVGCHRIENNVATVHQFITEEEAGERVFVETDAPPWLRGEGAKVQHAWLYEFLHNVQMLRPWLKVRMPSFHLTTGQTRALVEYFAALSNDESHALQSQIEPVAKYIRRAHEQAGVRGEPDLARVEPGDAEYVPRPGDDWCEQALLQAQRDELTRYSIENRLIHPSELEPFDPQDPEDVAATLGRGYRKILSQAAFLQRLYAVDYPFVDTVTPYMPPERLEKAEKLLYELQCLNCHVFGDPSVPGAHLAPTAPNLDLTHRRLRPEWVMAWLQGPGRIQPGTKMPALWPGGQSAFYQYPDPDRSELEETYGRDGQAQMELVRDLLYEAGRRSMTLVQPGGVERAAAGVEAAEGQSETDYEEEAGQVEYETEEGPE